MIAVIAPRPAGLDAPPRPAPRHYGALGVEPGAPVAECVAAFERRADLLDPRRWPATPTVQRQIIRQQDEADAALALVVDAARFGGAVAA